MQVRKRRLYRASSTLMRSDFRNFTSCEVMRKSAEDRGVLIGLLSTGVPVTLVKPDRRLQHEKHVVPARLDPGDDLGNFVGIGKRAVDRFPQFLHQAFQSVVHNATWLLSRSERHGSPEHSRETASKHFNSFAGRRNTFDANGK